MVPGILQFEKVRRANLRGAFLYIGKLSLGQTTSFSKTHL